MHCATRMIGWVAIVVLSAFHSHCRQLNADEEPFWAFQVVRSVSVPDVHNVAWPQSALDRFVLEQLEVRGLVPSTPADRRTLIRRATFDLIGLPPTPDEIRDFVTDPSPEAYERVVDRLLASPRYGERWGRHWLDAVRYADARDLIQLPAESDFREAWRYRDWVVASWNKDLPYDQFVMQQVAGDLMQPEDKNQIDADAIVATGLLAIADFVPGDVDKQQMIADYVNDQIDVVGRAFLGLTLACARCHDHKFDPISTEDYYALAGIFFSTRLVPGPVKGNTPLVRVPLLSQGQIAAIESAQTRDKLRQNELNREISVLQQREYRSYLERRVAEQALKYLQASWEFLHPSENEAIDESALADKRGLEQRTLQRWIAYLKEPLPNSALTALCSASDLVEAERQAAELCDQLAFVAARRQETRTSDPSSTALAESLVFRFQADDRRVVTNAQDQIASWPNRGWGAEEALPVSGTAAPTLVTAADPDRSHSMVHFSGSELLQVSGTVPAVGSLFIVFRSDPAGEPGQRLLGWEDASAGQHGLGIMTDAAGSLHVILRRNGANGDIVAPSPAPISGPAKNDFQTVCVTWGPQGTALFRSGQPAGSNRNIDSVSSDAAITALRIGGPGSGSSPYFRGDLAELRVYNIALDDTTRVAIEDELAQRWHTTESKRNQRGTIDELYDDLVSIHGPFQVEPSERDKVLPSDFQKRLAAMRDELEMLQKKTPMEIPRAVAVQEGGPPGTPHEGFRDAQVYLRGNHTTPGETVPRGFPKVIAGRNPLVISGGSGRIELAKWLVNPENPLTTRVIANRVWQNHFGVGIVASSVNFGNAGERPSHPKLLDFLAHRLLSSGGSIKAMQRRIMISSVYQQVSAANDAGLRVDPENRLLWRANRRRLEAEAFRDSLLDVAQQLDSTRGGPGFQDVAISRRSLYLMSVRTGAKAAEFAPLFDAPDCSAIVERRTESIVAPQALFLMNDSLVADLAKRLGDRVTNEVPQGNRRRSIERLYEIAIGRPPQNSELELGLQFLADETQPDAWSRYCRLLLSTNEFMFVD